MTDFDPQRIPLEPRDYAIPKHERRPRIMTLEAYFLMGVAIGFVIGGVAGILI